MIRSLFLLASTVLAGLAGLSPPKLRNWHAVTGLQAREHGRFEQSTRLSGAHVVVAEELLLTFNARGTEHTFELTRADAFPADASISLIRNGVSEKRPSPLLHTYLARNELGHVVASVTRQPGGSVRALVRDGSHDFLVIEAATLHMELPAGMAYPQEGEMFAYNARDVVLDLGESRSSSPAKSPETMPTHRDQDAWGAEPQPKALGTGGDDDESHSESRRGGRALSEVFNSCPAVRHRLLMGVVIDQLFVSKVGGVDAALAGLVDTLTLINTVYGEQVCATHSWVCNLYVSLGENGIGHTSTRCVSLRRCLVVLHP